MPSCLHLANLSSGRAKSYFVSKVKNFLLGDPNWKDRRSWKVLRRHFYQPGIFTATRIWTFVWPFCFLVYYSVLIFLKMVCEMVTPIYKRGQTDLERGIHWHTSKRVKEKKLFNSLSQGHFKEKFLFRKISCWGSLCAKVGPWHACTEDGAKFNHSM